MSNKQNEYHFLNSVTPFLVFIIVIAVISPLLNRSLWVDETMLLSNFPLDRIDNILQPLPKYVQAGAPIHNIFLNFFSDYSYVFLRSLSFVIIVGGSLIALNFFRSPAIEAIIVGISILSLYTILYYASEIKHYGLEILGSSIVIAWYLNKDAESQLRAKDLIILCAALFMGISTIVITSIALALYFIRNYAKTKQLTAAHLRYGVLYLLIVITYYLLIKMTTRFQIDSHPEVYGIHGMRALGYFIKAVPLQWSLIPAVCANTIVMFYHWRDNKVANFLIYGGIVLSVFLILSALGYYPVRYSRHLVWTSAFLLAGFHLSIQLSMKLPKFSKYIVLIILTLYILPVSTTILKIAKGSSEYENTENNKIISWLEENEPTYIGMWHGAQPAIEYYSRQIHELKKHEYFGVTFEDTKMIVSAKRKYKSKELVFGTDKDNRMNSSMLIEMYPYIRAKYLIDNAPTKVPYFIFASHLNYGNEKNEFWNAIKKELDRSKCKYEKIKEGKRVFLLSVDGCQDE